MSAHLVSIESRQPVWHDIDHSIIVGKDILELLSSSMYLDPMTIYREYVQNAADAIDHAQSDGTLSGQGHIQITIDPHDRVIKIRDNGSGVTSERFLSRMLSFGASEKRGTNSRGFRGVGRLAGLAYCQELIFRTRTASEKQVDEVRWDCRKLKSVLKSKDTTTDLLSATAQVVQSRLLPAHGYPARFFEVELRGIIRHRNDHLLNPVSVSDYLSQVAPVPFDSSFPYREQIVEHLQEHVNLGNLRITIGDSSEIRRPHTAGVDRPSNEVDPYTDVELITIFDRDGGTAAVGWIAHHGYIGALSGRATAIRGLRFRSGNIQVGDDRLLESIFPEPRFNSWAVGEIHVINPRVLPNGRRDHFEQSVHFDDLVTALSPHAKEIARRCRTSSIHRKWRRDFELAEQYVSDRLAILRQGAIRRKERTKIVDEIRAKITWMQSVAQKESQKAVLGDNAPALIQRFERALARIAKGEDKKVALDGLTDQRRRDYEHVISLIYECSPNKAAALLLVNKILDQLKGKN